MDVPTFGRNLPEMSPTFAPDPRRPQTRLQRPMPRKSRQFGSFTLDLERLCLRGPAGEVELRPKSFEALRYLVEHAGRVASKEEVMAAVWSNVTVTDDSLIRCINTPRDRR